jgi:hypothetical protein
MAKIVDWDSYERPVTPRMRQTLYKFNVPKPIVKNLNYQDACRMIDILIRNCSKGFDPSTASHSRIPEFI